ncbi:MAG TPA: quinohemoprotein amine dehydrogenase maturation protein, partial [Vicinamibacterales bacterium]|nr:quinohemoprotein amine dehydrogenase maturation protein [Vicinamibacterales bacterium]
ARDSVEFLLEESGASQTAHLTFFGGETLLNFPVLQKTIAYARRRAAEVGKTVDFSLTTNATLLKPEIIEFLAENHVGVTISIDGPKEVQDKFRVFHNGAGSYDIVAPKIKELLKRHRTRPIGARVTLTSGKMDVKRIYQHLTEEIGFWEVGFAPVTTAPNRAHAISEDGYGDMLGQFRDLAYDFLEASVANRHHGFSNVKETLEELHKGVSKAYPCGAGLGLLGVATDGDVALCHRFAGSDAHKLGTVRDGINRDAQHAFYEKHHIHSKTDCSVCWARPLCSGGCYHEAHTRYGDTAHANLHYCEWIRGWTDVCLKVYGELSVRNPAFLAQFDESASPVGAELAPPGERVS